jgi:hypothetical protein
MGTVGRFPGAKSRLRLDADNSPLLVPKSRMSRSYISSPPKRLRDVLWDRFNFSFSFSLVEVDRLFGGAYCLHHGDDLTDVSKVLTASIIRVMTDDGGNKHF